MLAGLGLSGLASFTTASRTKEIGIRKINGATTGVVMQLPGNAEKLIPLVAYLSKRASDLFRLLSFFHRHSGQDNL